MKARERQPSPPDKDRSPSSDLVLDIVNQWVRAQADVIPVVPGWNVLIKHPNDIRSVLTSRNYTKETGPNRYFPRKCCRWRPHRASGAPSK
jgi:hypothetical protein